MPLKIYDETLCVLRQAVDRAKLGQADKLAALARLDEQCRLAEAAARGRPLPASPSSMLSAVVAHEQRLSPALDGRVCGAVKPRPRQLRLPLDGGDS